MRTEKEELEILEPLREQMHYDLFSGGFFWIQGKRQRRKSRHGDNLSVHMSLKKTGYINFSVDKKEIGAHRMAFYFFYGRVPNGIIDHINGDPADNRLENLREATHHENAMNKKIHRGGQLPHTAKRTTIVDGTAYTYFASVVEGKYLGTFKTREEAHASSINFINGSTGPLER